jgi:hypothetical protein
MREANQVRRGYPGHSFFRKLWDTISPPGNIYRLVALEAEQLKHCEDIWEQIHEITKDGSPDEFVASIKAAPGSMPSEEGLLGFKPLEEFVATPTWRFCGLRFPVDSIQYRRRIYHLVVGWLCCWIQLTAPLFILINQYQLLPDRLKLHRLASNVKFREMICLGTSVPTILHTTMGIGLLLLILVIMNNYVQKSMESVRKSEYLPLDRFWVFIGNATNIWCTIVTSIAAPVMFWNESTPTSMSMDALTLLWLFTLDDFSSYAANIVLQTDEDFQRSVTWFKALLHHCPVRVADICDEKGNLHVTVDATGVPLMFGTTQPCKTRLRQSELGASTCVEIQRHRDEIVTLPHFEVHVIATIWSGIRMLFLIMQFATPFLWFVVNKPCLKIDD